MVRTISLSDDAYEAMADLKRPGESFSDVARRLAAEHRRRHAIGDSAGMWPMTEREADGLLNTLYAARERSDEGRPSP